MTTWTDEEDKMTERPSLLHELYVEGLRSPVTQQMLLDFCLAVVPLLMIALW